MKVLVTGATGFVGSNVCRELINHGYQVKILHRSTSSLRAIEGLPLEKVVGDLSDPAALEVAVAGVEMVFHVGALYREAKFDDSVYWKVNFEGTKLLLEAARKAGVRKFIHTSTTGVMGHIANPPANESHPYNPGDVYQESKLEAEKIVLEWTRSGKIDGCVIRPTMIWGPGDTRLFKLFKGVATRRLPIVGSGKTLNHYILVEDLARAFRLAAENANVAGKIYLIGGERIVTLQETMEAIAKVYGVRLLPFKLPVVPIQIAGSIVEAVCRPFGIEPPLHRRRADFFIKSRAFDISRAKNELGFKASYSFEDEVAYVAKWYVDNGWIKL